MRINHNISSINAARALKDRQTEMTKTMQKLASGMRINNGSDDPSGLAVSERLRTQINGLRQAERNTEDGLSLVQTADGYLGQVTNLMQRIRVLSVQAANGIYSSADRVLMQVEVSQLISEVDRLASQAEFNRFKLLMGDFARNSKVNSMWFHLGPNAYQRERAFIQTMTSRALGIQGASLTSVVLANDTIGLTDAALEKLMKQRADLGAYSNRLEVTARGLMSAYENVQASESRIRDADMAQELVELTRSQILESAASSMLTQANLRGRAALRLLE